MYPSGDLNRLAARKTLLQARIAVRRWECAQAAAELARPISLIDRGVELWHRIAPFIKLLGVPAAFVVARKFRRGGGGRARPRGGKIGMILRALPLIMRGVKMFLAWRATHGARAESQGIPRRPRKSGALRPVPEP